MKKLLLSLGILLAAAMGGQSAVKINGLYYELDSENLTAEVVQHPSGAYTSDITIPDKVTIDGTTTYDVVSIAAMAFGDATITSLHIPASVTKIGTSVTYGCSDLTSITIDGNNTVYTSAGSNAIIQIFRSVLIAGCQNTVIPSDVTCLSMNSFAFITTLKEIDIPASVTYTESQVFMGCTGLEKVTMAEGLGTINGGTFARCSSLKTITFPSTVTWMGSGVLAGCDALETVVCMAENPPTVSNTYLHGKEAKLTLRVPKAAIGLYEGTSPWNRFGKIKRLEGDYEGCDLVKSTFTEVTDYFYGETFCQATLASSEGNNWTYEQMASEMNGPRVKKTTVGDVECMSIRLKSLHNKMGNITLRPLFEMKGTVVAIIVKAGGNLGKIEATFDVGNITQEAGKSSDLKEYFLETDNTVMGKVSNGNFSLYLELAEDDSEAPIYLESITVVYEKDPEPVIEDNVSTFTGWNRSTMTLTTEEPNHDWEVTPGEDTNVGTPYSTAVNANGVYESCMCITPSGSASPKLLNLTSTFTASQKVYKIIVRAKQGINNIYATINGEKVYSRAPKYYDALADYIIDVPEDVDLTGQQLNVSIEATGMFFLQKITFVIQEDDTVVSGTAGNLTWKAELLPGWWSFDGDEHEQYLLRLSGNGATDDYDCNYESYPPTSTAPWSHLIGINEVVVEEGATRIGKYAFANLPHADKITLPSTLEAIGDYALRKMSIKTLAIPSAKTIGTYAIADNSSLREVVLPEGLTSIGYSTFDSCNGLLIINIPSTVTTINKYAFRGTTKLETVTCLANPENLTWTGYESNTNFKAERATKFLVKAAYLEAWQTKFADLNVTFEALPEEVVNVTDLNDDGAIDTNDATFVLDAIASGTPDAKCDMNGDGKVDIADVIAILKYLAEK